MKAILVFPHQLFEHPITSEGATYWIIEEHLFFRQFNFHPLKRAYHRATMKVYERELTQAGRLVNYIESADEHSDVRRLFSLLAAQGIREVHTYDVVDDWLSRRMNTAAVQHNITLTIHPSPMFMETAEEVMRYSKEKKRLFHADFYKQQRLKHQVLVDEAGQPLGGQWSFDADNRKKYPKGKQPPKLNALPTDVMWEEACAYVRGAFDNPYDLPLGEFRYPINRSEARQWLGDFLEKRFVEFGEYEDAIVKDELVLHHSVLTPMLNIGLLTPNEVVAATLHYAEKHDVPLNSLEGFIRQVMGWREYIRMVYLWRGREERTRNFWGFNRPIPDALWKGTTGIEPVDDTIRKVRETGYCHHIERLMVMGNFMLLNEYHPDEVYRWFMEFFIDAYDWVMVPNVYGMSQFADGGMMATKPYISGSNYLMKMSNHAKGPWQEQWDALFWRFMHTNRNFFLKNPRLSMLVRSFDKMPAEKRSAILNVELL
ncbi:MAG: cryptochrome/photolyase family protein [Flavobacteriales bacterium]